MAQAESALRQASTAFDAENFGGAVYLATQAKRFATAGRGRLAEAGGTARPNERPFALPVPLTTTAAANLRDTPSGSGAVISRIVTGTALTAYSYEQDWLKVATADGASGWVHQSVVRSAAPR